MADEVKETPAPKNPSIPQVKPPTDVEVLNKLVSKYNALNIDRTNSTLNRVVNYLSAAVVQLDIYNTPAPKA